MVSEMKLYLTVEVEVDETVVDVTRLLMNLQDHPALSMETWWCDFDGTIVDIERVEIEKRGDGF
jgi:hypothetical protein